MNKIGKLHRFASVPVHDTPSYKLGRLAPAPVAIRDFTHYLTTPLPTAPATLEPPKLVYPMADNDRLGCCTIAAVVHVDQAIAHLTGQPWTYPGDSTVQAEYFHLTGGQDTGLVETDVLKAWSAASGLFSHRLAAFAPINIKHQNVIKQATWLCGAVYTGILIPAPAQEQFAEGKPWELTGTSADDDIEGGHAVPVVGYNADGFIVVTWGKLQQMNYGWWAKYGEESYATIAGEVKNAGKLRGLDFKTLDADLAALHSA